MAGVAAGGCCAPRGLATEAQRAGPAPPEAAAAADASPGQGVGLGWPRLLQVLERALLPLDHSAHPTERGALEALAAVERVAVLEQLDVVLAHGVDELPRDVHLAERQLEVIAVVEHVDQVGVERVDVLEPREVCHDLRQPLLVAPASGAKRTA